MTAIDLPPLPPEAKTVMLFDASKSASEKRFTVVNLDGPTPTIVLHTTVAHGVGSDPDGDGVIERFSNEANSLATSLGRYKVAESYFSDKWESTAYRLDGLDPTNSNARNRAVVLHPSRYVRSDYAGRSWGCPALSFEDFHTLQKVADLRNAYIVIYTAEQTSAWLHYNLENPICTIPQTNPSTNELTTNFFTARSEVTWPVFNPLLPVELFPMPPQPMETTPFTWLAHSDTPMLCLTSSPWEPTPMRRTTMA